HALGHRIAAAGEDAVDPAVDLLLRLRVVAVRRLRTDDVNHADALGRERLGHQIGGLFLSVDLAAVSNGRAIEQVEGIVGAVVQVPELLLVPCRLHFLALEDLEEVQPTWYEQKLWHLYD